MKNANVIEGHGCRQGAWAAFAFYSSFLQLDAAARLNKNGAVAQINATGIGIPKSRRIGRQHCGYFFVRRHGTPSYGRAVWGSASCAGSLTRYANLHGSAHPRLASGLRKLSTAVKELTAMSRFKTPTKGKSTAAPKKPARRTLPAPTPASIHALFVALRTLGWRSGMEHAHGTRRPPPESVPVNASTPLPSAEQIEATFMAAWKLGWEAISNDEASFLLGRNRLTQDGIGHLYEVAICIQKDHPWQLSLAERCAGVYKVPHYCTSELPPVSPATPREQAMFAVLRQVGIYAYQELGHAPLKAPPLPDMEASSKRLTGAWHNAARVLAMELGWWRTNPREVELIHLLRRCNDKGRDILCATLSALLRRNRLGNYQGDTK